MPATIVLCFEKRPRLADRLRNGIGEWPARLFEARTLADLAAGLQATQGGAICLIDGELPAGEAMEAVELCASVHARILLVGDDVPAPLTVASNRLFALATVPRAMDSTTLQRLVAKAIDAIQRTVAIAGGTVVPPSEQSKLIR